MKAITEIQGKGSQHGCIKVRENISEEMPELNQEGNRRKSGK